MKSRQTRPLFLLAVFCVLNAILWKCCITRIPKRDVVASVGCLVLSLALSTLTPEKSFELGHTKRFLQTYQMVMTMEIVFSILAPWLVLIFILAVEKEESKWPDRIAPHLFFFQSQIIGELLLLVQNKQWYVFEYTVAATACCLLPVLTCLCRSLPEDFQNREFTWHYLPSNIALDDLYNLSLPLTAALLWAYSTFWFLPIEWYPLVKETRVKARKLESPEWIQEDAS